MIHDRYKELDNKNRAITSFPWVTVALGHLARSPSPWRVERLVSEPKLIQGNALDLEGP